jgi:putative membrane protein
MVSARHILDRADRERIEQAIADAERHTSAELVVIVARRSGRYDRSEDVFGLVLGLLVLVAAALLWPGPRAPGSWDTTLRLPLGVPLATLLVAAGFFVGVVLSTRFPLLARPFRTKGEMAAEVRRRASDCFADFRVRDGQGCGVLIYVSLLERTVWITADDTVSASGGATAWPGVRDAVVRGLAGGSLADGLCNGVREAAEKLAKLMPPTPTPRNRLPNTPYEIP